MNQHAQSQIGFLVTDGVLEFYLSRRMMTRMDLGDTIIRYGEFAVPGFSLSNLIVRRPPETKHNFQFTGGIGFRF